MFVAAMLKGVRLGFLPKDIQVDALAGYEGILKEFVSKDEQGFFHLNRAVSGAGLGGTPYRDGSYQYYVNEPKRDDDLKAIGPFMQACIEYEWAKKEQVGRQKNVVLDRFFNNEYTKEGKRFHYTWEDNFDSGFSWLGNIFKQQGATLSSLDLAPSKKNLANAQVYIIVDPDHKKDNPKPNVIKKEHIKTIEKWVAQGGNLLLMINDTTNADVINASPLAKVFGIEFTMKNINFVKNDNFPDGVVFPDKGNEVLNPEEKLYVKELVTLSISGNAKAVATKGQDIIMATSNYGKGKVFVVGDPWLYNEYVNGRKLPSDFKNFEAANDLVKWLLH
jgi:unsaturated rhamnogalacturonyl hydrolase